jgi:4-hydroxythreonine-4-phosphate dehydrogenase
VGLLTDHIPVSEVASAITPERIVSKVKKMEQSLREDFQIPKPKIALLGINPHSGDNGVIGKEDDEIVRPTIKKLIDQGTLVYGPYASDSFFGTKLYTQFDAILASYHDQGLIPFKTLAFGNGVNYTAGLLKVRTSPDHGTAYDIAGKNQADASSFEEAMFLARTIYFNRREQ